MNPVPYKAAVNETWNFELDPDRAETLDWVQTAPGRYHLLRDHQPFRIEVVRAETYEKRFTIRVNGRSYTVVLADDLDQQIDRMGFQLLSTQSVSRIEAPMPGLILSPREGVIREVAVQQGAAVDKKSLLGEFET